MQEEQRLASSVQVSTSFKSENDSNGQAALESDMYKTIVRLNTVTEGRPFFILHGAGGGVLAMRKVARKVNYPVYGVQDTPEAPITGTLDLLSHFYLSKIKERQPLGPYCLGGFSFGERLLLEMLATCLQHGSYL
jgi:fatty acid synthase, animal type